MSASLNEVREVYFSEIASGRNISVDDVRTVFLAAYDERIYSDPENEICTLIDGDKGQGYCITDQWLDDLNTCGWFLERLPTLVRPQAVAVILSLLHDKLEDPVDKAFRTEMRAKIAQGKEEPWMATPQG